MIGHNCFLFFHALLLCPILPLLLFLELECFLPLEPFSLGHSPRGKARQGKGTAIDRYLIRQPDKNHLYCIVHVYYYCGVSQFEHRPLFRIPPKYTGSHFRHKVLSHQERQLREDRPSVPAMSRDKRSKLVVSVQVPSKRVPSSSP